MGIIHDHTDIGEIKDMTRVYDQLLKLGITENTHITSEQALIVFKLFPHIEIVLNQYLYGDTFFTRGYDGELLLVPSDEHVVGDKLPYDGAKQVVTYYPFAVDTILNDMIERNPIKVIQTEGYSGVINSDGIYNAKFTTTINGATRHVCTPNLIYSLQEIDT